MALLFRSVPDVAEDVGFWKPGGARTIMHNDAPDAQMLDWVGIVGGGLCKSYRGLILHSRTKATASVRGSLGRKARLLTAPKAAVCNLQGCLKRGASGIEFRMEFFAPRWSGEGVLEPYVAFPSPSGPSHGGHRSPVTASSNSRVRSNPVAPGEC